MKTSAVFFLLVFSACSSVKQMPYNNNNEQLLSNSAKPVKIFSIGFYNSNSVILTLVDAKNQYLTLQAPVNNNLKIGDVYP
jgi:hypothetical protein